MAGREFGPPPTVVTEFNEIWRNWLYLLFRKVYQKDSYLFFQAIDGIGDGQPSNTMQEGLIGLAPVTFAEDNRRMTRNFSFVMPEDWVKGTPITFGITFANVDAQSGVQSVVTEINFKATGVGEDLSLPGIPILLTTTLATDEAANILQLAQITIIPLATSVPGTGIQFELARNGQDAADTVSGDVGYKDIVIKYQSFLNPG